MVSAVNQASWQPAAMLQAFMDHSVCPMVMTMDCLPVRSMQGLTGWVPCSTPPTLPT